MKTKDKDSKKNNVPKTSSDSPQKDGATIENGRKKSFYIVGMGGSAGSLEAFDEFFRNMPADTGLAFVLVSHLDPTHKGIMPELLQRVTTMRVQQAKDGMKVQPNHVYIIPPNKDMSILHGTSSCWCPPCQGDSGCPSISFSGTLLWTRKRGASASSSPEWDRTVR